MNGSSSSTSDDDPAGSSRWNWIGADGSPAANTFDVEDGDRLVEAARYARSFAHAPYSGFHVGAAVMTEDGETVATGCNVENASFGATLCAERAAIAAAVLEGARDIAALALSLESSRGEPVEKRTPCGICRQVLAEFGSDATVIYLDNGPSRDGPVHGDALGLADLLPLRFRLETED